MSLLAARLQVRFGKLEFEKNACPWVPGGYLHLSAVRPHTLACVLTALLSAACASVPPSQGEGASGAASSGGDKRAKPVADRLTLKIDGEAPFLPGDDDDKRLGSDFSIGIDSILRYRASWSVEPGDVIAGERSSPYAEAPVRFGGQSLGQNVNLSLPELAGAPVTFEVRTETENNWLVDGSTQLQRERASLSWAPGPANVNVQWSGYAAAFDSSLALTCDLQSTVFVPTHEGSNHSESLSFSGRDCVVPDDGSSFATTRAQAWGMSYTWNRPKRQSEAIVSVIDPAWSANHDLAGAGAGYELGLRHRRTFGTLNASALVSLRRAPTLGDAVAGPTLSEDTNWAANASLTWQLQDASLSANWATGVDRFWFTPEASRHSDQFGLALNMSRWIESLIPRSSPQFAMNWNWSEVSLPGAGTIGSNSLRLDVALMF